MANDIKRCFEIGISIGEILAYSALWEVGLGGFVEFTGQQICIGLSDGCICRPALRLKPFFSFPGGVAVNGDEDVVLSVGVGPADSFFEGDVDLFRDESDGFKAYLLQAADYCSGDFSCVTVLAETAVRRAFAGGLDPVSVVDQDFHSRFKF